MILLNHVFFQILAIRKLLVAHQTKVLFYSIVGIHVSFHISSLGRCKIAVLKSTFEWFFKAMRSEVIIELGEVGIEKSTGLVGL